MKSLWVPWNPAQYYQCYVQRRVQCEVVIKTKIRHAMKKTSLIVFNWAHETPLIRDSSDNDPIFF